MTDGMIPINELGLIVAIPRTAEAERLRAAWKAAEALLAADLKLVARLPRPQYGHPAATARALHVQTLRNLYVAYVLAHREDVVINGRCE